MHYFSVNKSEITTFTLWTFTRWSWENIFSHTHIIQSLECCYDKALFWYCILRNCLISRRSFGCHDNTSIWQKICICQSHLLRVYGAGGYFMKGKVYYFSICRMTSSRIFTQTQLRINLYQIILKPIIHKDFCLNMNEIKKTKNASPSTLALAL